MNRDEIRKLAGGYATGSLTESEKKLLFEAALDDQDLFEELAEQQILKETIDAPGARDRLLTALQPEPRAALSWLQKPWPWAAAGALAMGVVLGVVLWPKPPKVEMSVAQGPAVAPAADVRETPKPEPPKADAPVATAPAAKPPVRRADQPRKLAAAANPAERTELDLLRSRDSAPPAVRPSAPAPASSPAPPPPPPATERAAEQERRLADAKQSVLITPQSIQAAGGIPAPPARQSFTPNEQPPFVSQQQLAQSNVAQQAREQEQLKKAAVNKDEDTRASVSGGRLAAPSAATMARSKTSPAGLGGALKAKAPIETQFALSYRFDQAGHLDLTALAEGYLIVTTLDAAGQRTPYALHSRGHIDPRSTTRINLPDSAASVEILFSAIDIARDPGSVERRVEESKTSGLIEDPTPSPNSRFAVILQVPKRN